MPKSRHCFLSSVQPENFLAKVIRCSEWRKRLRNKSHIDIINHFTWQKVMEMSQPSAHRIYLQQSTKKKVEVLHKRHEIRVGQQVAGYPADPYENIEKVGQK